MAFHLSVAYLIHLGQTRSGGHAEGKGLKDLPVGSYLALGFVPRPASEAGTGRTGTRELGLLFVHLCKDNSDSDFPCRNKHPFPADLFKKSATRSLSNLILEVEVTIDGIQYLITLLNCDFL